jgi:hypothetical protein
MDHGRRNEVAFTIVFHADGDARDLQYIAVAEQWAVPGFADTETDLGKAHNDLLVQVLK